MLAAERCLPAQTAPCRAQQRRQAARAARRAQPCRAQPAEVVYHDSWSDIAFIALCRCVLFVPAASLLVSPAEGPAAACRRAYGKLAGWQSSRGWRDGEETYKGMVEVSKALMKGRSAAQQREAVVQGFPRISPAFRCSPRQLAGALPVLATECAGPGSGRCLGQGAGAELRVPPACRKLFPFTRKGAELNAQLTLRFFPWLVGPMQVDADDKAVVRIERCRRGLAPDS